MELTGNVQGLLDLIGGGVQDVKVDGVSVVNEQNVANITLPDAGVQDVEVDGVSVVNEQGVAEITLPDVPVQDVEVDGVSVVNEQGVAEITLPDNGIHYSTDEQVIGTWIDGKPLYQKTIQVSNKTCNSTGFMIDTGLTNVKNIIDEKITVYINQYSEEYLLPYYRASTSEEIIPIRYIGSSGVPYLQVRTRGANYGACSAETTLQYTKTTD